MKLVNETGYETALQHHKFPAGGQMFNAKEIRDKAFIVLRGRGEDFPLACKKHLALDLPESLRISSFGESGERQCLWISPDEFLVIVPQDQRSEFLAASKDAFAGDNADGKIFAAAIDNSGSYSYLVLGGAKMRDVLAKLCFYDLSESGLPANKVVSTPLGKANVILFNLHNPASTKHSEASANDISAIKDKNPASQQSTADEIHLLVKFSYADYVWRMLAKAAEEYHPELAKLGDF